MNHEITYTLVGDYFLPNIKLQDSTNHPLGKYGQMHKTYLQEHRTTFYNQLLLSERLYPLCREIDEAAKSRLRAIPNREIAHEVILTELVFI